MADEKEVKAEETKPAETAAPAPAAAPAAPAEQPAKKSHTALIVVIVLVVLFVALPLISFGAFWIFVGSKVDKATKDLSSGKVNISTSDGTVSVNTSTGQSWPSTAPSVVPKFTAGKITGNTRVTDVWDISYSGVTAADVEAYRAKLAAAGFTTDAEATYGNQLSLSSKKGEYSVTILLNTDEKTMILGIMKDTPTQ